MRRQRRPIAFVLLVLAGIFSVSCKTSEDAVVTAAQMTTTAANLGDYYAALERVVDTEIQLERLQQAVLQINSFDEQRLAQLNSAHLELQKRAVMARSLARLASALTELTQSTAAADASTAAASLGTELSGIQQLPFSSYAPSALPPLAKILTQFQLEHDERKLAKSMEPIINGISDMFDHERDAYDSINRTYIALAQSLAGVLVKNNQVSPDGLVAPALAPFGLTGRMPVEQMPAGLQSFAHEEIDRKGKDEIAAYAAATETMDHALKEITQRVQQLANDGRMPQHGFPFTFSEIHEWTRQLS